jgi:hypothetical protein
MNWQNARKKRFGSTSRKQLKLKCFGSFRKIGQFRGQLSFGRPSREIQPSDFKSEFTSSVPAWQIVFRSFKFP